LACERPLLILFGENSDTFDGVALKDRLEASVTHRRVFVVPGTSHFMPMEKPEEVARLAIEFFSAE
jgi:pimeloyl-ACP methyl ester carboxylesterase